MDINKRENCMFAKTCKGSELNLENCLECICYKKNEPKKLNNYKKRWSKFWVK